MKRIINENTRTTWKEWSCSKREVRLLQVNFRGNKMYCKLVHPTTFSIQIKKLLWKNKFSILAEKEWSLKKNKIRSKPIQLLSVQKCFFLVKMRNGLLFKNRFNRTRQKRNDLARNGGWIVKKHFFLIGCKIKGVFMTSYLLLARIGVMGILSRFGIDNVSLSGNCTYLLWRYSLERRHCNN